MEMSFLLEEPISSELTAEVSRPTLTHFHSASHIDIVRLDQAMDMSTQPSLDLASKHTLTSAHGEEVVRAIVIDDQVCAHSTPWFCSSHTLVGIDFHSW